MSTDTGTFVVNPYIAGSPVKDSAMFFGREDVYAWLRQHLRGEYQDNVIVLFGERRSGKTSVLYQMKSQLGDERYVPVLLDLQGMGLEGVDGFLWEVARKIVLSLRGVEGVPLLDRPNRQDFEQNPQHYFEDVFLPPIIAALGKRRLLLMFDEAGRLEEKVQAGEMSADIFDYLRAVIQHGTRMNFLFSLGSRVETMSSKYSQLFSLAVYRKISFLDQDFAEDLITQPVAKYYSYSPAAIGHILRLTAGQPYYTQLVCHNLFTRWARNKPEQMDVADVEAVLPDVIEQGTPNLQFVWEDSSRVEQAVLAGLADEVPKHRGGVLRRGLDRALRREKLYPPPGDVTSALRELFERDVLNDREPYEFRVDLIRLWLGKYKQLEWVREELGPIAREWERQEQERRAKAPTRTERALTWATPVLAVLLLGMLAVTSLVWRNLTSVGAEFTATIVAAQTEQASSRATIVAGQNAAATAQAGLAAAQTRVAQAEAAGNAAEVARAQAEGAEAAAALARVTEEVQVAVQQEATAIAAVTEVAASITPAGDPPTATSEATPVPTATFSPAPPTPTPAPPTATPLPGPQGLLAIPVDSGGRYVVRIYEVPGGALRGEIPGSRQPSFRDSDSALAVNTEGSADETIWVYDSSGRNGRKASVSPADSHPAWGPDGQSLVYDNRDLFPKEDRRVWRIFVQNGIIQPTSNDVHRLAGDIFDADRPLFPLWTADGQVVFWACDYWTGSGGQCGVWRTQAAATVDGAGFRLPERVTTQNEIPTDVQGSRLLVMGTSASGDWEVYLGSVQGGELKNLSNSPGSADGLATFSPDGRWVAFVSNRGGSWGVYVIPADGGEATRLPIDGLAFGGGERDWTTERISWGR